MFGRVDVDAIVRSVMRALDDGAETAAHSLDDPGFHGPLNRGTHATLDGTLDFEPPRTSQTERDVRRAVEQVVRPSQSNINPSTNSPIDAGFHGSLDPRDFFGI